MKQRIMLGIIPVFIILTLALSSCVGLKKIKAKLNKHQTLTQSDIAEGLKDALRVGSTTVVKDLGKHNGFYKNKIAHIVLPKKLVKIRNKLKIIGYSKQLDDLELKLNRAAEKAVPKAKRLFINVIQQLSWQDIKQIYHGPDDAATRYFQRKMSPTLKKEMYPIIDTALEKVGVVRSYKKIIRKYNSLPFVSDAHVENLTDYTINKTLKAMFYYLAIEEAAIRKNPAKRTTQLLRRVFGAR